MCTIPILQLFFFISEGYGAAIIFIIIVIFLIISSVSGEKAIIKEAIKNALKEKKEEKEKKHKDILHISLQLKNEDMAEFTCDKEVMMRNQ